MYINIDRPLSSWQAVQICLHYLSPEAGLKWTAAVPGPELTDAQSQPGESSPTEATHAYIDTHMANLYMVKVT